MMFAFLCFTVILWFGALTFPRQILENKTFAVSIIFLCIFLQAADAGFTMFLVALNDISIEANPLMVAVFQQSGFWGFIAVKLAVCVLLAMLLFNTAIQKRLVAAALIALTGSYSLICGLQFFLLADEFIKSLP